MTERRERLRAALSREGFELRARAELSSLAALERSLRAANIVPDAGTLRRLAWAALGLPRPRTVRLTPTARARLSHLSDLRDVFSPADAQRVGREFAGEAWLAADLLAARPWLPHTPAHEVVSAVMDTQWAGLLALLGECGPWVYAANVADLQALGSRYGALVGAAAQAREDEVLDAALGQAEGPSLLARLEATDHRQPSARGAEADLAALETAFWTAAKRQALNSRETWRAGRR